MEHGSSYCMYHGNIPEGKYNIYEYEIHMDFILIRIKNIYIYCKTEMKRKKKGKYCIMNLNKNSGLKEELYIVCYFF